MSDLVRNPGDRVSLTAAYNVHAFGISGQEAAIPCTARFLSDLVRSPGDRVSLTAAYNVHAFGISGQEAAIPMPALLRKLSNREEGKPRIKRSPWCLPGMRCM